MLFLGLIVCSTPLLCYIDLSPVFCCVSILLRCAYLRFITDEMTYVLCGRRHTALFMRQRSLPASTSATRGSFECCRWVFLALLSQCKTHRVCFGLFFTLFVTSNLTLCLLFESQRLMTRPDTAAAIGLQLKGGVIDSSVWGHRSVDRCGACGWVFADAFLYRALYVL